MTPVWRLLLIVTLLNRYVLDTPIHALLNLLGNLDTSVIETPQRFVDNVTLQIVTH